MRAEREGDTESEREEDTESEAGSRLVTVSTERAHEPRDHDLS